MIDLLLHAPASVKVISCFAGILIISNAGIGLGPSILLFSALLSLWSGTGGEGLACVAQTYLAPEHWLLMLVVLLLMLFTEGLGHTGRMRQSIDAMKTLCKSRSLMLAGPPALIGLLPMPGGALFSAPFVGHADPGNAISPEWKTIINYWFRHIWEYWWPLYPGVILAMQYSELTVGTFILYQSPFTLVTIAAGYLFILRRVKALMPTPRAENANARQLLNGLAPILLIVLCAIVGAPVLCSVGVAGSRANLVATLTGIIAASIWIFYRDLKAFRKTLATLKKNNFRALVFLIIGVLAFSEALKAPVNAQGATLVANMRDEFMRLGMPIAPLIVAVAFISGAVTGIAMGFVGASFPLIFALIGPAPSTAQIAGTTILAYGSGYAGMMLSPLHTCFAVSGNYFGSSIYRTYRYLIGPVLLTLACSLAIAGLWYWAL